MGFDVRTKKHYVVRCLGGRPSGIAHTLAGAHELVRIWDAQGRGPATIETVWPEPPQIKGIRGSE